MSTGNSAGTATRVATVVLNYRHVDDTLRCVRSLQESDLPGQRIVVVDNAEEGPTTAALRAALEPDVVVLASGDNLGYAGGNNHGIRRALRWEPEFIWLVNPDAVVQPKTLTGLVRAADAHPDVGIVGCRILVGGSSPPRIEANGGWLDDAQWWQPRNLDAGLFDREVTEYGLRDVDWVSGGCALLRVAMIDDVGLLPEEYFLYFEDTEHCRRAQSAGWRTVITLGTRIWHFRRSVGDLPSASYLYYLFRNRIHFCVRHFDATVDDLLGQYEKMVQGWRSRVEQAAPELLDSYDSIVRQALDDARAGRFGRAEEIEAIDFAPDATEAAEAQRLSATLERERAQAARDAWRLLDRIAEDSATARDLERSLAGERRQSERLRREGEALRASRSFRFGRVVSRLVHPAATTRALLSRNSK